MIEKRSGSGRGKIVLLPLPLYGYELDRRELLGLTARYGRQISLFDLYGAGPRRFRPAVVRRCPRGVLSSVGKLTTALMARRLLQSQRCCQLRTKPDG